IKREVERFRPDYALRRLISVNPCFDVDWPLELRHALSRTTRSGNAGHNLGRLPEERVHNPAIGLRARSLAEAVTVVRFCDSCLELFPQLIDWCITSRSRRAQKRSMNACLSRSVFSDAQSVFSCFIMRYWTALFPQFRY